MLIEEKPLKHWIDNFYGYGSWHAKIWFIGYEESGGEVPEEVAEKLNYFYKVHPWTEETILCDIRDLYQHVAIRWDPPGRNATVDKASLFSNRYEYRFASNAIQNGVWKNLIAFVHGYKNENLPDLLEYQKSTFVSQSGNEALMQLYPLPSPHNHAWYYSWLDIPQLGFLKSRTLYQEYLFQRRMETIAAQIKAHKPEVVLMYGMDNITALKSSLQQFFPGAKFKMNKATKLQIPQHHRADLGGTTMLITTQIPALRHNRVETGFDWEEFGKRVRSENV
ncbi:MAG TPA: hypothetical protein VE467_06830 [Chryseolinea sp.]|nr:hypothetical protein [Chryseolinea sp.]